MTKSDDVQLDRLLRSRIAPAPPEAMEDHIIALAAAHPGKATKGALVLRFTRPWYADIMHALALPRPAYALGVVLLFGLMIGIDLGGSIADDGTIGDWSNLFSSGDGWL